jgi:hypothetical protein
MLPDLFDTVRASDIRWKARSSECLLNNIANVADTERAENTLDVRQRLNYAVCSRAEAQGQQWGNYSDKCYTRSGIQSCEL